MWNSTVKLKKPERHVRLKQRTFQTWEHNSVKIGRVCMFSKISMKILYKNWSKKHVTWFHKIAWIHGKVLVWHEKLVWRKFLNKLKLNGRSDVFTEKVKQYEKVVIMQKINLTKKLLRITIIFLKVKSSYSAKVSR